ncbi:F-box/kelch-repeat protein At3g23880-like [Lotus japonicus]|uniref:F-box/kelch-repeat protein At3g23880-like n=1 Tax=Lotus japonicus TaxID=34305 RepID=UPI00258AE512|nr:F-box/kelch-repeat protein At3g23880-like [Lotus japonicus]
MNIPPPPKPLCQQPLPDELIVEVLSWLPVKTLIGLRCVSKIWNSRITSDASFIKLHRQRSAAQNPQLLFQLNRHKLNLTPFPISRLVENPLTALPNDPQDHFGDHGFVGKLLIGSCNGLICIHIHSLGIWIRDNWICFWNPATRFVSEKLGYFRAEYHFSKFTFGYDNTNDTYKVVFFDFGNGKLKTGMDSQGIPVKVFTLGDNLWRDIQSLPVGVVTLHDNFKKPNDGVNLSGTLNWMALHNNPTLFYDPNVITVENILILSLDLGTETYNQFSLPGGFDEVPCVKPNVQVLMDYLCFCHVWKKTHFVIWQMKEFGVENSWTQLLKISYQDLQIQLSGDIHYQLFPLFLYNGHTLILVDSHDYQAILFNMRDNRAEKTRITNKICWSSTVNYIETLASPQ